MRKPDRCICKKKTRLAFRLRIYLYYSDIIINKISAKTTEILT